MSEQSKIVLQKWLSENVIEAPLTLADLDALSELLDDVQCETVAQCADVAKLLNVIAENGSNVVAELSAVSWI
jgi:hypothetical protein